MSQLALPKPYQPPVGFRTAFDVLADFHKRRAQSDNPETRADQRDKAALLVSNALQAGSLIVFILTKDGSYRTVPAEVWTNIENIRALHGPEARPECPLSLTYEGFSLEGVALIDRTNFENFCHFCEWPDPDLPPFVRMLVNVAADRREMGREHELQKADVIAMLRTHWPRELEKDWPEKQRLNPKLKSDANAIVKKLATLFHRPQAWKGRSPPNRAFFSLKERRDRRDPRRKPSSFAPGLSVIDDDVHD